MEGFLYVKERRFQGGIEFNIYEVEGEYEYERAHAGSDYEYLIVKKCSNKNIKRVLLGRQVLLGGDELFFKTLNCAYDYAKMELQKEKEKLEEEISKLKITLNKER